MKEKTFIFTLCLAIMVCCVSACNTNVTSTNTPETPTDEPTGKIVIESSSVFADTSKDELLGSAQIIVLGEVFEELPGKYTNPDGEQINKTTGNKITNAWETSYKVAIKEIYKGEPYDEKTIIVKVWNRVGFPPYDEEKYVFVSDEEDFYLDVGTECILCLRYDEDNSLNTDEFGYYVACRGQGCFVAANKDSPDIYSSTRFEIDLKTISEDIHIGDKYMAAVIEGLKDVEGILAD